jgi:hypothetical protein
MIITRNGERFKIITDRPINEAAPNVMWRGRQLVTTDRVTHEIEVRADSESGAAGILGHIAKGATRGHCLLGLLDQGVTIEREKDDPDEL